MPSPCQFCMSAWMGACNVRMSWQEAREKADMQLVSSVRAAAACCRGLSVHERAQVVSFLDEALDWHLFPQVPHVLGYCCIPYFCYCCFYC